VEAAAVSYSAGTATLSYNASVVGPPEIRAVIESLDYRVLEGRRGESKARIARTLGIILVLYALLRRFGAGALTAAFPLAEAGMDYGMLLGIGLVTSVHCVAMCGGLNLSQCIPAAAALGGPDGPGPSGKRRGVLVPSALYNTGRVLSYTAVGVLVGALGSVISLTGTARALVQLAAGAFMVVMGLNMLGLFPALRRFAPRLPGFLAKKVEAERAGNTNPLAVGLLNGLLPCGPLQAMQLYALSTGSPLRGGISMFLFSLGTVPLMFGLGALSSLLSRKFTARVQQAGAVLVAVLGLSMFSNGWNLGGFPGLPGLPGSSEAAAAFEPPMAGGKQILNSSLSAGNYPAITVRAGIPVRWIIDAPPESINGCNNRMIIREYGIEHRFLPGENIIEFTPDRPGKFSYSCWMGMIRSTITVAAAGTPLAAPAAAEDTGGADPVPAGVSIPADTPAVAELAETGDLQRVRLELRDEGFLPSILVMQRKVPVEWIIHKDSADPGSAALLLPSFARRIPMDQGDNPVVLLPTEDFVFSTADYIYYGYVKVLDDLSSPPIEAIQAEAAAFETLMYPDDYFESDILKPRP
jgi:sulfite exporter TauE/SafE